MNRGAGRQARLRPLHALAAGCLIALLGLALPAVGEAKVTVTEMGARALFNDPAKACSDHQGSATLQKAKFSCSDSSVFGPATATMAATVDFEPVFSNGDLQTLKFDTTFDAMIVGGCAATACMEQSESGAVLYSQFELDRATRVKLELSGVSDWYQMGAGSTITCLLVKDPTGDQRIRPCPRGEEVLPQGSYAIEVKGRALANSFFVDINGIRNTQRRMVPAPTSFPNASGWLKFKATFGDGGKTGVSVVDVVEPEGTAAGNSAIEVPIVLDSPAATPVTVQWTTIDGSASSLALTRDYFPSSGSVEFQPGETVKKVTIPVVADSGFEPDETIAVRAKSVTAGTELADDLAFVRVLNDDEFTASPNRPLKCSLATAGGEGVRRETLRVGRVSVSGCWKPVADPRTPTSEIAYSGWLEADEPVWIGGLNLVPSPGSKIKLKPWDRKDPIDTVGSVNLRLGNGIEVPFPMGSIDFSAKSFTASFNTAGSLERLLNIPLLSGASAGLTVTWDADGQGSQVDAEASLDSITESLGEAFAESAGSNIGTLGAKVSVHVRNGEAPTLTGTTIEIPEIAFHIEGTSPRLKAGLGGIKLVATIENGVTEWSGEGSIVFPWFGGGSGRQAGITGRIRMTDGKLVGIGLGVSGLAFPVGQTGFELTGISGDVDFDPEWSFDIGSTYGHVVKVDGESLVKLTGNAKWGKLAAADCSKGSNPLGLVASGTMPLLERTKLAKATINGKFCAYVASIISFSMEAGIDLKVTVDLPRGLVSGNATKLFEATGQASGWMKGTDFNLEGKATLTLPGVSLLVGSLTADGVLSSAGYAFCAKLGFTEVGFGTRSYLQMPTALMNCDFTPYKVTTPRRTKVRGAAVSAPTIMVPSGQSVYSIELRGVDTAPRVRLVGPGGVTYTTPTDSSALIGDKAIIIPQTESGVTSIWLKAPAAGSWRIEPLAGTSTNFAIRTASKLPEPKVTAKVKQNSTGSVTVTWSATNRSGRKIALYDRSNGSAVEIRSATDAASGTVTFNPANPLVSSRNIEARLVSTDMPRPAIPVVSYRYTTPAVPSQPSRLTAKRSGTKLSLSWSSVSRANAYLVTVTSGGRVSSRVQTTRTSLTFSPAPAGRFEVAVRAIDRFDRTGIGRTAIVFR